LLLIVAIMVVAAACVLQQATLQRAVVLVMLMGVLGFCCYPLLLAGEPASDSSRTFDPRPSGATSSEPVLESTTVPCRKCTHSLVLDANFLQENLTSLKEQDLCVVCRECGAILELRLHQNRVSIGRVVPRGEVATSMYFMGLMGVICVAGFGISVAGCVGAMPKGQDPVVWWMVRAACGGICFLAGIVAICTLASCFSLQSLMRRRGSCVF